ncbi:DinB family protein [Chryseobacterium sp. Alg-005]|uniref:DinB family protein n=1 Tax=Chryseobacterium sp. Alg-005 TaxID=3159516 RepID=UPI003555AE89
MTHTEIIILNFEEIRRRSIKLWSGLPPEYYYWKPDIEAMTAIEMIRHVLEGEHLFHKIVENRGNLGDYISPWQARPYTTLQDELNFAQPFREKFFDTIKAFSPEDLTHIEIIRSEKGQKRILGDYLQRIAYHESVHTGQMLAYFRTLGLDRPLIWD